MWDYIQDDLTSIVFVSKKDQSVTIKIYGFDDNDTAETFAHYTKTLLNFDYDTTGYSMHSKIIHYRCILRFLTHP